jgi:hypothetical protein
LKVGEMVKKRIYTHVSEKAVKGFQRLAASKHVYVTPAGDGEFTVVTIDKPKARVREAA